MEILGGHTVRALTRGWVMGAAVLALGAACAGQTSPAFDVIVAGGNVVDGSGSMWFRADIGVRGGSIAAIGSLDQAKTKLRLDARGLVLAPGFIDIHSHARRGIFDVPLAENYIRQGVTTVIEGQDGSSPLPIAPFLEKLAAAPPAINFGLCVGHGSLREKVMGAERRQAAPEELEKMKALARQAMREGAFGLSTGLFYVPGNYANTEEVIAIAREVGRLGGFHVSHMRDEAAGALESVKETIRIGEEGGLPTQVTHHKLIGKAVWGKSADTLKLVEEARARGVDVTIDQYPYTASSTSLGAALLPQWASAGGRKALLERLDAPEQRAKIKAEVVRRIAEERGGGDPANIVMAACAFDPKLAGMTLSGAARLWGRGPSIEDAAETAIEIHKKGGCQAVFHAIAEEDIERILRYPHTMVASDGGVPAFGQEVPHPRSYGTFARVLGRYVRERRTLALEEAVRKMSSLPAARLKLWDRGLLRPGMKADIVAFDPAVIRDTATFAKPHQYAEGVKHVLVNGQAVLADRKITGVRPGRVLYGPGYEGAR